MATEQVPGSYEIPNVDTYCTPDEAVAALEKVNAEVAANPKTHPYMNPNHPQSKSFRTAVNKLYEIKHNVLDAPPEQLPSSLAETHIDFLKASSAEKFSPAQVATMREGIEEQAGRNEKRQAELTRDIWADVNRINSIWKTGEPITNPFSEAPASPALKRGYRALRLLAEKNYSALTPLLIKDVRRVSTNSLEAKKIEDFLVSAVPGDVTDDMINDIIRNIFAAEKKRANRET